MLSAVLLGSIGRGRNGDCHDAQLPEILLLLFNIWSSTAWEHFSQLQRLTFSLQK